MAGTRLGRTLTITQGVEIQRPSRAEGARRRHRRAPDADRRRRLQPWWWRRDTSASNSLPLHEARNFQTGAGVRAARRSRRGRQHPRLRPWRTTRCARCSPGTRTADADIGRFALADVELLAPIPHPGTIFAIGLNYAITSPRWATPLPEWPTVFVKVNTCGDAPGRPDRLSRGRRAARLRGRADDRDRPRRPVPAATASPTTSAPVTCRSASRNGCVPRAPTPSARSVPGSPPPMRSRTHRTSASARGSTASCARTSNTSQPRVRRSTS